MSAGVGSYTPKPGDRVKMRSTAWRDVIVESEYHGGFTYRDAGGTYSGGWVNAKTVEFELVAAAPVPFVIGGPITPEMGEPPPRSIVVAADGGAACWQRSSSRWYTPGIGDSLDWDTMNKRVGGWSLLRLGDGGEPA